MKKYILFLILSFFNSNMFADTNIFGYWLTSGSIVKIENCNNLVCGKIITVFVEDGIDPNSPYLIKIIKINLLEIEH